MRTPWASKAAERVRSLVRNPWAHYVNSYWTAEKFLESMILMETLAETVCCEDEVLERLKFWKEEGVR